MPYVDDLNTGNRSKQTSFRRLFRKFRLRAGVEGRHFHDLRRTALSEMGDAGATNSEIVSFSGHSVNSKVIDVYVQPSKKAAKHAHQKRWGKNRG